MHRLKSPSLASVYLILCCVIAVAVIVSYAITSVLFQESAERHVASTAAGRQTALIRAAVLSAEHRGNDATRRLLLQSIADMQADSDVLPADAARTAFFNDGISLSLKFDKNTYNRFVGSADALIASAQKTTKQYTVAAENTMQLAGYTLLAVTFILPMLLIASAVVFRCVYSRMRLENNNLSARIEQLTAEKDDIIAARSLADARVAAPSLTAETISISSSKPASDDSAENLIDFYAYDKIAGLFGDKIENFVKKYISNTYGHIEAAEEAIATEDRKTLHLKAHTMKSGSGTLGLYTVSALAADIEILAAGAEFPDSASLRVIQENLTRIKHDIERISGYFETAFHKQAESSQNLVF